MQHNKDLGKQYEGISHRMAYKFQCRHDLGFQWYSNAADGSTGYSCIAGCGQKVDFNPDYFLYEGNVKPLGEPNPTVDWKVQELSKGGKF